VVVWRGRHHSRGQPMGGGRCQKRLDVGGGEAEGEGEALVSGQSCLEMKGKV
jgi:hypothetical protein